MKKVAGISSQSQAAGHQELQDFGYCVFGPLLFEFSRWLLRTAESQRVVTLYFLSREGWFLKKLFEHYLAVSGQGSNLAVEYLLVSRRAVFGAVQKDRETLQFFFEHSHFRGSLHELMEARIGIGPSELDGWGIKDDTVVLPEDCKAVVGLLMDILPLLNAKAEAEREPYLAYLQQIGYPEGGIAGLVDLGYSGSIQKTLYQLWPRSITGFYAAVRERANLWATPDNKVEACFGIAEDWSDAMPLIRFSLYLEAWLTSPQGQLVQFKLREDGTAVPVFAPAGAMQYRFEDLEQICVGVQQYFDDACACGLNEPGAKAALSQHFMGAILRAETYFATADFLKVEDKFCNMGEVSVAQHYKAVLEAEVGP